MVIAMTGQVSLLTVLQHMLMPRSPMPRRRNVPKKVARAKAAPNKKKVNEEKTAAKNQKKLAMKKPMKKAMKKPMKKAMKKSMEKAMKKAAAKAKPKAEPKKVTLYKCHSCKDQFPSTDINFHHFPGSKPQRVMLCNRCEAGSESDA